MKRAVIFVMLMLVASIASATTIAKPYTFSNGQVIDATKLNADWDTIYAWANGNVDNTNIGSGGIFPSQLKCTSSANCTFAPVQPFTIAPTVNSSIGMTLNCPSGMSVDCLDVQINGANKFHVSSAGNLVVDTNLQVNGHANQALTTAVIERFTSGAITVATTNAFPLPSGVAHFIATAASFQCQTAGVGTSTGKWQYTTSADPVVGGPTWTDITGATFSWTTAGGNAPVTFTGVDLTGLSALWVRWNQTVVGGTAPQNCSFYLHATQYVQ